MPTKRAYPFRFYGRRPNDWIEGANLGHRYELQFVEPLSAEKKALVAEAFEKKLKRGAAEAAEAPWLWAERSAQFLVGERGVADFEKFFDAMESLCRAIAKVAPLEQVIFWGARGFGDHAWDQWSVAQRAEPDSPFRGAQQAKGDTDLAFEEAREIARLGAAVVAARKEREAKARATGKVTVVQLSKSEKPPRAKLEPHQAAKFAGLEIRVARRSATGRVIAKVFDGKFVRFAFLDDAGELRIAEDVGPARFDPAVSADGRFAYLGAFGPQGEGLYEVALPAGTARLLVPQTIDLTEIVVGAAGGLLALGLGEELRLLDVSGAQPVAVATHPLEGEAMRILSARGGTVLVVVASGCTSVFGVRGRKSALLGEMLPYLQECYEAAGRIVGSDFARKDVELLNVDLAYARAFPE